MTRAFTLILLFGLSVGTVYAAEPSRSGASTDKAGGNSELIVGSEVTKVASMSNSEMAQYAASAKAEIAEAVVAIADMLQQTKQDDVDTLQCLTSRHTAVRALLVVTEKAEASLKAALAEQSDTSRERASHEARKIAVALEKARQLLAEARQCGKDETLASGDTLIELLIDQGFFTFSYGTDTIDVEEVPPQVSPFN